MVAGRDPRFSFCPLVVLVVLILTFAAAEAVMPPRPGSDARLPAAGEALRQLGLGRVSRPDLIRLGETGAFKATAAGQAAAMAVSSRSLPVLLGDTSDLASSQAVADFQAELFGTWPTGSLRDYYAEISYGQFQVTGQVFGWFRLPRLSSYYEGASGCNGLCAYPTSAGGFERDLVALADASGIDWGPYDNDGPDGVPNSGDDDGYVDTVIIVHSGEGGECGGNNAIWSHSYFLRGWGISAFSTSTSSASGGLIKIDDYIIQPEISCYGGLIEIGVFCHEYGHALGLPDLYDTSGNGNGIGRWGLMGSGSWGGDGASPETPVHMNAWSKVTLGWATATVVPCDDLYELSAVELAPAVLKVWSDALPAAEYFLVENRQRTLNDALLPGAGLNIWHIDEDVIAAGWYTNQVNVGPVYGVALEQADGFDHLENRQNRGDGGDPWPGSSAATVFNNWSDPNSRDNDGQSTKVIINSISSPAMTMSAFIEVGIETLDTVDPVVTVLSPNGGEDWAVGAQATISWTATDDTGVESVSILLSYDGGGTFAEQLATGLVNTGSWTWPVPLAPAADLVVQVLAQDPAGNVGADASNKSFSVSDQYPPGVSLSAPAGGEVWQTGSEHNIKWAAADNIGVAAIDLFLSVDGGLSWPDTIAYGLVNSGSFRWTIPARFSNQCCLRARARDAAQQSDYVQSDLFTLANLTAVAGAPGRLRVGPAVPNPFNPQTTVHFENPEPGRMVLMVFNLQGRRVRTLLAEDRPAGPGQVPWNGRDDRGRPVGSGVYYLQALAGGERAYSKLTLIR